MLLLQVLATCDEYDVRLTGELYAQLLKTQLLLSHASDSSKTGGQLDDVLHALTCLKEAEGNEWALLLRPGDRLALCAVLNKHMQPALLLQTVWPWHSKVCVPLLTSDLLHHPTVLRQVTVITHQFSYTLVTCRLVYSPIKSINCTACCCRQQGRFFTAFGLCCLVLAEARPYSCCAAAFASEGRNQEVAVFAGVNVFCHIL